MPLNETVLTVVIVASAMVTIVSTFSTASAAICMVYRIFRPENEAPALAPRLGRRDVLPPPVRTPSLPPTSPPGGETMAGSILPRLHGFFRGTGVSSSPRQMLSMLAAMCSLISATTSLMSASSTVRHYWRIWGRRNVRRRTIRVRGGVVEPTHVSVATSPIPSTSSLTPVSSENAASHLLELKAAIESAVRHSNDGVKLRLGSRNCKKSACKPNTLKRKLSAIYGKHGEDRRRSSRSRLREISDVVVSAPDTLKDVALEKDIKKCVHRARKNMDNAFDTVNIIQDDGTYDDFSMTLRDQVLKQHETIRTIRESSEESQLTGENSDSQRKDFQIPEASGIAQKLFQNLEVGQQITNELGGYIEHADQIKEQTFTFVKSVESVFKEYGETIAEGIKTFENQAAIQIDSGQHLNIDDSAWGMAASLSPARAVQKVGGYIQKVEDFKDKIHDIVKSSENILQEIENRVEECNKSSVSPGASHRESLLQENLDDSAWGIVQNMLPEPIVKRVDEYIQRAEEFKDKAHTIVKSGENILLEFEEKKKVESIQLTENQGAIKKVKRHLQTNDNALGKSESVLYESVRIQIENSSEHLEELKGNAHVIIQSAENVLQEYGNKAEEIVKRAQNIYETKKNELDTVLDQMTRRSRSGTSEETLELYHKPDNEYINYATEIKDKAYEVVRTVDELLERNSGTTFRRKSTKRSLSASTKTHNNNECARGEHEGKGMICIPQCDRECSRRKTTRNSGVQSTVETTDVGCSPSSCDKICYAFTHFKTTYANPCDMNDTKINIETSKENINVILKELVKKPLVVIKRTPWPNRSECLLHNRKEEAKSFESVRPESAGARKREVGPKRRNPCRSCKNECACMDTNSQAESSQAVERKTVTFSETRDFMSEHNKIWCRHSNEFSAFNQRKPVDVRYRARESLHHIEADNTFQGINSDAWFMNKSPIARSIRWKSEMDASHNYIDHSSKCYNHGKRSMSTEIEKNVNILNTVPSLHENIRQAKPFHRIVGSQEHETELESNNQIRVPDNTCVHQQYPHTLEQGKFSRATSPISISKAERSLKTPVGADIIVTATYRCKEALSHRKNNEINKSTKKDFCLCSNVHKSVLAPSGSPKTSSPSPSRPPNMCPRKRLVISKKRCQTAKMDWGKKYSDRYKHLLSRIETGTLLNKGPTGVDKQLQRFERVDSTVKPVLKISPKHKSCEVIWRRDCRPNTPHESEIQDFSHDNVQNTCPKKSGTETYTRDSSNSKYDSEKSEPMNRRLTAFHLVIPPKQNKNCSRINRKARSHYSG